LDNYHLTSDQEYIAHDSLQKSIFLHGSAGTGKTTAAIARLTSLIGERRGNQILILVPQKTLGASYSICLDHLMAPYSHPTIITLGGLARRIVQLFWPLISKDFGFFEPHRYPTFLNLETSQYYFGKLITPFYERGFFRHVPLDKNRLVSQLIDNLNKAAITGLKSDIVMENLVTAWTGKPEQLVTYEEAQSCINEFRLFCMRHQLLDYSLLIELFHWAYSRYPELNQYILSRFRHLIYENSEEDVPVAHVFVRNIIKELESSLIINDDYGGFRSFLGADPISAVNLSDVCDQIIAFNKVMNNTENSRAFGMFLSSSIQNKQTFPKPNLPKFPFEFYYHPYIPDAIQAAISKISLLVKNENTPPQEIVVLSPYLPDILMHQFQQGLLDLNIPNTVLRPSRSMIENPIIQSLTTLAVLAHPHWNIPTNHFDMRNCIVQFINGFDPLRADIFSRIIYPAGKQGDPGTYEQIANSRTLSRIPREFGEKFDHIRSWMNSYSKIPNASLVYFYRNLFEDILYQPGYCFWDNPGNIEDYARLVKSIENFYSIEVYEYPLTPNKDQGKEYIELLRNGVIAAAYDNNEQSNGLLTISPIHTYLMANRTVQYQIWFDIGSQGWWERLYQPLTHPVVLSQNWEHDKKWTDTDEVVYNRMSLSRIIIGLTNRCSKSMYLYAIGRDEQGIDQKGPLLMAIQKALREQRKGETSGAI
jgi:hypothetical protein